MTVDFIVSRDHERLPLSTLRPGRFPTRCGHSVSVGVSVDEKGCCDFRRASEADYLSSAIGNGVGGNVTLGMRAGLDRRNPLDEFTIVPDQVSRRLV